MGGFEEGQGATTEWKGDEGAGAGGLVGDGTEIDQTERGSGSGEDVTAGECWIGLGRSGVVRF